MMTEAQRITREQLEETIISEYSSSRERNNGQSTVEFVLTLILFLAFFLFYFQLAMVFAFGSYVHYATFMSARAYLAGSSSVTDQNSRAREVIVTMLKKSIDMAGLDKFPSIAKGVGQGDPGGFQGGPSPQYVGGDRDFDWMQGVTYTFKSNLFVIPLGGVGQPAATPQAGTRPGKSNVNTLVLTSESWLGKEPSEDDCRAAMSHGNGSRNWLYDNGC